MMRSKYKRIIHSQGMLGTGETSLLDYILPKDAQGKPAVTMNFTLDTQSIIYTGFTIMTAMIVSGVVVNKISGK